MHCQGFREDRVAAASLSDARDQIKGWRSIFRLCMQELDGPMTAPERSNQEVVHFVNMFVNMADEMARHRHQVASVLLSRD